MEEGGGHNTPPPLKGGETPDTPPPHQLESPLIGKDNSLPNLWAERDNLSNRQNLQSVIYFLGAQLLYKSFSQIHMIKLFSINKYIHRFFKTCFTE